MDMERFLKMLLGSTKCSVIILTPSPKVKKYNAYNARWISNWWNIVEIKDKASLKLY